VLHRAEPRWGCGWIPVASRVVGTAGPGAGAGGPGGDRAGRTSGPDQGRGWAMTRSAVAAGGHGDREFLLVHGARFMLASVRD